MSGDGRQEMRDELIAEMQKAIDADDGTRFCHACVMKRHEQCDARIECGCDCREATS